MKTKCIICITILLLAFTLLIPTATCEDTYTVSFTVGDGGRLSINSTYYEPGTYNFTDDLDTAYSFEAFPATNFTFSSFDINGTAKPYNPYNVTLTGNMTVAASFVSSVTDAPTKASDFATLTVAILIALFIIVPVLLLVRRSR